MATTRRPEWAAAVSALVLTAALAAGCTSLQRGEPAPGPSAAPQRPAEVLPVDPRSADMRAYYTRIEDERRARGLMRTDPGTQDVVVTPARLAETYIAIALNNELSTPGASSASVLRRWEVPVRYSLEFGASTGRATRVRDYQDVRALAARMGTAANHQITVAPLGDSSGNFHVLVLSESERQEAGERIRTLIPGIDERAVRLITDMPRETFCLAMAFARDGSAAYTEAIAVIRAEHPDLTRLACYHEELSQGLGLAADSGRARPSIFNDDQEFALLTDLDLLLLQIHYDPRLRPGMTEREARPIIFSIASELVAGAS